MRMKDSKTVLGEDYGENRDRRVRFAAALGAVPNWAPEEIVQEAYLQLLRKSTPPGRHRFVERDDGERYAIYDEREIKLDVHIRCEIAFVCREKSRRTRTYRTGQKKGQPKPQILASSDKPPMLEMLSEHDDPSVFMASKEIVAKLSDCIQQLPEGLGEVVGRKINDQTYTEIGELLGLSTTRVRVTYQRSLQLLKSCMERNSQ